MDEVDIVLNKCLDGNNSAVESLISEGVSPNFQNSEGESLLQVACANGFTDIAEFLLKKGASVDLPNNYGWTPLMHAARHGHSEIVALLIKVKAKVNMSNRLGLRPIDLAAWSGNDTCVNLLIDAGAVIDNMDDQNDLCDLSPLMAASLQGYDSVIRILLEKGSSVNQVSSVTGLTPLMLAACCGYLHIIEILIEWGIDVNVTDKCGQTALNLAIACNRTDVITYLENVTLPNFTKTTSGIINTNILLAIRSGDIETVLSLLQQNQSFSNYIDPIGGITPLMVASMHGQNNIVDVLISNGANLNAQDLSDGWTPLMHAVFHRQAETVHLLLDKGAKVDICTSNGYTALDLAVHIDSSETDIVETLTAHSAPEELLETQDYFAASPSSSIRRSHLSAEKVSSRGDSQARLKDWIGSLSSHLRSRSKSSAASSAVDSQILEESMSDVFICDSEPGKPFEGNYISISKFYAPNQRFAHILKEQEVEAIILPPLPNQPSYIDLVKRYSPKKTKACKNKNSKSFNSLRTPNLVKSYFRSHPSECLTQVRKEKNQIFESLDSQDLTLKTTLDMKFDSSLLSKSSESKDEFSSNSTVKDLTLSQSTDYLKVYTEEQKDEKIFYSNTKDRADITAAGGLTDILNQGSLQKYAEKFRDQEIDLETFQHLTEDDLSEIGIKSLESRNKFMEIIQKLKNS